MGQLACQQINFVVPAAQAAAPEAQPAGGRCRPGGGSRAAGRRDAGVPPARPHWLTRG